MEKVDLDGALGSNKASNNENLKENNKRSVQINHVSGIQGLGGFCSRVITGCHLH